MTTEEKIRNLTDRAKTMIQLQSTENLLDIWEMTTNDNRDTVPTVRGWLMDEFEARDPEGFAAWINLPSPEDKELRNYIKY